MKKNSLSKLVFLFGVIFVCIALAFFFYTFRNFNFSLDVIWKIEEQRREHIHSLSSVSTFLHNKVSYVAYLMLETYLSYLSPSAFFCCGSHFVITIVILILFYMGLFYALRSISQKMRFFLMWIIIYPIIPALILQKPSLLSVYLFAAPIVLVSVDNLLKKFKSIARHHSG